MFQEISHAVSERLKFYVYRLIDPRDESTFYVGKGKGSRVCDHARGIKVAPIGQEPMGLKLARIHEIMRAGYEVSIVIHRHGLDENTAFEVEGALINAYPGLTNAASGKHNNRRGAASLAEIIQRYGLPPLDWEPKHRLLLIHIKKFRGSGEEAIYQQTRFAWNLDLRRAKSVDYVLSVFRGAVVGAWQADYWAPATRLHFEDKPEPDEPKRTGFTGRRAPDDIWSLYVGRRLIAPLAFSQQNTVRYWFPRELPR